MYLSGGRTLRMFGSGREVLPDIPKWLGEPPPLTGCLEVVGRTSGMSGSGRETFPDVPEWWEALLDVREWLGGPPGHPVVVNWPS